MASRRPRRYTEKSLRSVVITRYSGCSSLIRIKHKSARSGARSARRFASVEIAPAFSARLNASLTKPVCKNSMASAALPRWNAVSASTASQVSKRIGYVVRSLYGPLVVPIAPVAECYKKAGVGYGFHLRENPWRDDRLTGPLTAPASRIKGRAPDSFALSSSVRTIFPRETPDFRAVSSSHSDSSSGRRTVSVLPICRKCNTCVAVN